MNQSEYQKRLFGLRTNTTKAMDVAERRALAVLQTAADDLEAILRSTPEKYVSYSVYAAKKAQIDQAISAMSKGLGLNAVAGMNYAARNTARGYADVSAEYARSVGFSHEWEESFAAIPVAAVDSVIRRVWPDNRNFSDRLWRMDRYAKDSIRNIVTAGVARGQSAVNMSKDIRAFLIDPRITPGVSWTTAIKKSKTGNGTIHHNALRLARTEINNSYREALIQSNENSPMVKGVKWNLSAAHKIPDICDVWAFGDSYGMGTGVFPALYAPIDHPSGLCFMTDVFRKPQEWSQPKEEPVFQNPSKEEALSVFAGKKMTPGQLNAAWKMYEATNKMVTQEVRKAA